ncbi:hypothetical protein [Myroides odoratus]|uniref:hypothetical protein n=1 Tax=Myroides odoratus TaxID=256 RepID=UPI0039AFD5E5
MIKKIFLFLFFCSQLALFAQGSPIFLKFTTSDVQADEMGYFSSTIEISNLSQSEWTGKLAIEGNNKAIRISSSTTKLIRLSPGQKTYVPVIANVDQTSAIDMEFALKALLTEKTDQSVQVAEQAIFIQKNRKVFLLNLENQIQFQQVGDSIFLRALIQNKGNTAENLHYVITFPNQLNKQRTLTLHLPIQPQKDTLVSIKQFITKEAFKLEDFDISATLLYENGDFIARTNYTVSSLKSKRKYRSEHALTDAYYHNNTVELNRIMGNNVLEATQLIGSTTIQFSENTKLGLTGDLIYWDNEKKVNLRHFLADFQTENMQIQAGNIFQSGEFSLQGRGIQTTIKIQDSLFLQAGYLDKTYLITDANDRSIGYNTWIGFQSNKHHWKQSQFYYDLNHRYKEKKNLWYNSFSLWNKPSFQLDLNQGASLLHTDETNHFGAFLGINAYATLQKYQIQHSSFYSSPYYAGIRQGVSQVSTNVRRNFNKHTLGIVQNFIHYAPKYSYTNYYNSKQQSNTIGLSYSYRMQSSSLSISPQFVNEQRYNYHTFTMDNLNAIRLTSLFTKSNFIKNFGYNLSVDLGNYITQTELNENLHYRINVGLNYKSIDLGLSYQYNYSNLSELINVSYFNLQEVNTYTNLMLMGNFKRRFFNNQLGVVMNAYYSNTSTSGDLWQFNTRIEYKLKKDFDLYVSNYNTYGGFSSANKTNYIQIGVIKQLLPYKVYEKAYNLKVYVYYQDEDQQIVPASNRIVIINNKSFVTTNEGMIEYKKLPENTYTLQVQNDKNWFATPTKIELTSSSTSIIYLKQTTTITGIIQYEYSENAFAVSKNLSGQRITAQSNLGEIHTTYTADDGRYAFYLPKGEYTITVYPENKNVIEVPENSITINTEIQQPKQINFILKVKDKEVQVKKFKSISF